MKTDEAIEDIRRVRKQISAETGNDPERLIARLMELQQKFSDRLVARPAGAPSARRGTSEDEAA